MGLLGRLRQTVKETAAAVQQMQDDAAGARAEWGDGGTARPGWSSAGGAGSHASAGGQIAAGAVGYGKGSTPGEDAVPAAEVDQLNAWVAGLRGILATGTPGTVIVRAARDEGERLARHAVVVFDLELRLEEDGVGQAMTVRLPVCGTRIDIYNEGVARPVRFDPADPARLAFEWQGKRRSDMHRHHVKFKGIHGQAIDLVGLLPGRALVEGYSAMLAPGEVSNAVETDLWLRLRMAGGALSAPVRCGHNIDWKPVKLLELGLDVPVAIDPVSGELEDVVVAALTDELRPRFGDLSAADQMFVEPIRDFTANAKAWMDTAKDITSREFWEVPRAPEDGGFAAGDPILAPANGVTFEQWVAITAGLIADAVPPAEYDTYAQRHGVAAGAWADGARQWQRRQMGHPMMAEKFGRALERAQKAR